jgi:hypothetical protein
MSIPSIPFPLLLEWQVLNLLFGILFGLIFDAEQQHIFCSRTGSVPQLRLL